MDILQKYNLLKERIVSSGRSTFLLQWLMLSNSPRGKKWSGSLTTMNVLYSNEMSIEEFSQNYLWRWDIEVNFHE
ncbi:MAG: hypothetical protein OEW75_15205 [Cyclobacteriaceae bacterium]|nr:hypothetical protein [Cyclobacteriaceae bacterium]